MSPPEPATVQAPPLSDSLPAGSGGNTPPMSAQFQFVGQPGGGGGAPPVLPTVTESTPSVAAVPCWCEVSATPPRIDVPRLSVTVDLAIGVHVTPSSDV